MKKAIVILIISLISLAFFTSSKLGGGATNGADGTCASGNTNTCARSGCHDTASTTNVSVHLDSIFVNTGGFFEITPVNEYVPGMNYQIVINAHNLSHLRHLPAFGYQVAVVKYAGAGTAAAVGTGTLQSTFTLPGRRYTSAATSGLPFDVVENSLPIGPSTGTGDSGTAYYEVISWKAPAAGTGPIRIYAGVTAVNWNDSATGDAYNSTMILINEIDTTSATKIKEQVNSWSISTYPNPVHNDLFIQIDCSRTGTYSYSVVDLLGKCVCSKQMTTTVPKQTIEVNTQSWSQGMYYIRFSKDGIEKQFTVSKF
ncbi:MAG: T9SS type A sorting domain-containing protein [Bacteroidota bacterium]